MTTNASVGGCEREALEADLEKLLATFMGRNGGPIENSASDAIPANLTQDESVKGYEYRLTVIEQRYRKRLSGLDGLVGQLQSTSDFLSRLLKELPLPPANADLTQRGAAARTR